MQYTRNQLDRLGIVADLKTIPQNGKHTSEPARPLLLDIAKGNMIDWEAKIKKAACACLAQILAYPPRYFGTRYKSPSIASNVNVIEVCPVAALMRGCGNTTAMAVLPIGL